MDLFSESKNAGRWLRVVFQRGFVANTHLGVQATSLQYSIRLERVYLGFIPQSSLPLLLCLSTLVSSLLYLKAPAQVWRLLRDEDNHTSSSEKRNL
jgi:hypothetical protein